MKQFSYSLNFLKLFAVFSGECICEETAVMDDNDKLNSILWNADFDELHRHEDPEFIEVPVSDRRNSLVLFRFKRSAVSENVQKRPAA